MPYVRWSYYKGVKGCGGWTTKPDRDGWFHAFYLKPSGPGARAGKAQAYTFVPRTDTRRRKRKDAEERAFQLAMERRRVIAPKAPPVVNPPGTGYCMSCKEKVAMQNVRSSLTDKGRQIILGACPNCLCRIQKFGKVAECPECMDVKEMGADDYICKECRGS